MKKVLLAAVVAAALTCTATASAGGWAGSRYDKGDCTYNNDGDSLYCEAWFTEETYITEPFGVFDDSCVSGIRMIERTGWHVTTYRGWGAFTGRVPHSKNEVVGNEDGFNDTWRDYTDVDRGCLVF